MDVKLLSITQNPLEIMYTAARTCYSATEPQNITNTYTQEKAEKLLTKVLSSGHLSILEHCTATFAISGISRACSHQLVRHRHCTFSQQSQRYVEIKEDIEEFEGEQHAPYNYLEDEECVETLDKYFVWDHNNYAEFHALITDLYCYLYQTREGQKAENARNVLPNATKTNIVLTCNFRELAHMANLRLCARAQGEIRELTKRLVKLIVDEVPFMKTYLVPNCEKLGVCTEDKCCGRKPQLNEVLRIYDIHKDLMDSIDSLSERDWKCMSDAINNPKFNDKLYRLMSMKSVFDTEEGEN